MRSLLIGVLVTIYVNLSHARDLHLSCFINDDPGDYIGLSSFESSKKIQYWISLIKKFDILF